MAKSLIAQDIEWNYSGRMKLIFECFQYQPGDPNAPLEGFVSHTLNETN